MANTGSRKKPTDNQRTILYDQVDGICPACSKEFSYYKSKNLQIRFEVAHIYPLNPTNEEIETLKDAPRLNTDVNNIDNLIALCPNCHGIFDNPRDLDSYTQLYNIKKSIIEEKKIKGKFSQYTIEQEIRNIIKELSAGLEGEPLPLEYSALKIDQKMDVDFDKTTKKHIENDIVYYYNYVKELFAQMDKQEIGKFNLIAGQVKTFYRSLLLDTKKQEVIYTQISEWIYAKINKQWSLDSCKVIVAFFIQDCEVFEDVS